MRRLVCIGECMVELAALGDGLFRQGFAGDTFNTAWYARRALGPDWTVSYFTAVGDDRVSARMLDFMAGQGIETSHVRKLAGRAPGLYMIDLDHGERSFTYWRDTSAAKLLADDETTLAAAVDGADAVYFSGITLAILAPDARARLLGVMADAKRRGALVGFDSNIRLRLWPSQDELREAIRQAAGVITLGLPTVPDESDLFAEGGSEDVANRYAAAGVPEIVVRAGSGPALAVWPEGRAVIAPGEIVTPVDTTGAGDSFNGSYMAARLQGDDPVTAVRKAHATAARVIRSHGALVDV